MNKVEFKRCIGPCGEPLPLSAFSRHRRARDGYMSICKVCYVDRVRRRDMDNLTRPMGKMARYTSRSIPVPMPEKTAEPEKPKPQ